MGNQQSRPSFKKPFSSRRTRSVANPHIQGDFSGNSGSHNTLNSGNTNSGNTNTGNINSSNTTSVNINTNINTGNTTTINAYNQEGTNSSGEYSEILQCLYTSAYGEHRNRVREPVEGTCTWVIKHPKYLDWLGKRTTGPLWISADPGCGKSVIASFLVTHLRVQTRATICYFFFKDDSDEQRQATFALCAILHQLFVWKEDLCKYAAGEFKAKGKRFTEEVDTLWNVLVEVVTKGVCGDVICVLDALDECEEATRDNLIRHINRLHESQTSGAHLRFLVTSRPYHRIEIGLGSPPTTIRLRGEDEVNSITTDVSRVIDEGVKDLESHWNQPGALGYLRDLLESSADRTFLWVSLILEILRESVDDSREEFTNIVSTAPRDLADLYTKILDKSTRPDKARRILNIVVAAARPLTLREMNVALKISRDHKSIKDLEHPPLEFAKTIKNLCGLFVRIIDLKVYLVHQTAREFLIKGALSGQGRWQYTLSAVDANFMLADICMSYISLQDFASDRVALLDWRRSTRVEAVQKFALLDYAANHWFHHLRDSHDRQRELLEFTTQICERGSTRCLAWLRVYWESEGYYPFPDDFSHLMIASWLGQRVVVERLLAGDDVNAQSKIYGTALNVAALRIDEGITRLLVQNNIKFYLGGKEYIILQVKSIRRLTWLVNH